MNGGGFEFNLFGVPIKVQWMFFFVAAMFGFNYTSDPMLFIAWVGIMFLAILLHEMGHAFAYLHFGVRPSVVIHGFGGLTYGRSVAVGRSLLVSLAGPAVGITIGLSAVYLGRSVRIADPNVRQILAMVVFTNLFWGILNLLPLMPLDGGNATNSLLSLVLRRDMTRATRVISIITACGLVGLALEFGQLYGGFLAAYFGYQNFQALQNRTDVSRFSQHKTYRPEKAKKQSRAARRASRAEAPRPSPEWDGTPPQRPPQETWQPTPPKPTSKLSTVGWVQPGAKPERGFAVELDTAANALSRDQPELALIALDRARKKATEPHEHAAADQLHAEIMRRLNSRS